MELGQNEKKGSVVATGASVETAGAVVVILEAVVVVVCVTVVVDTGLVVVAVVVVIVGTEVTGDFVVTRGCSSASVGLLVASIGVT